jgi:ATP-dependent helicase/DNAse subunit B
LAGIAKGMTITGRIDRIDQNPHSNQLIILDYKTGKTDSISSYYVEKGAHLQLPLYAFLAKKKYLQAQIANAGIYSILDNDIKWLIKKDENIDDLINHAIKHALLIIQNIRQGRFNLPPINESRCNYCDYVSICPTLLNTKLKVTPDNNNLSLFDN